MRAGSRELRQAGSWSLLSPQARTIFSTPGNQPICWPGACTEVERTMTPETPEVKDLAKALRDAWYAGRPIVPIVCTGLSADSGFPVLSSIVRYFGKLHQYIRHRAFLPPLPQHEEHADPLTPSSRSTRSASWRYMSILVGPTASLNEDLLARLQDLQKANRLPEAQVRATNTNWSSGPFGLGSMRCCRDSTRREALATGNRGAIEP